MPGGEGLTSHPFSDPPIGPDNLGQEFLTPSAVLSCPQLTLDLELNPVH